MCAGTSVPHRSAHRISLSRDRQARRGICRGWQIALAGAGSACDATGCVQLPCQPSWANPSFRRVESEPITFDRIVSDHPFGEARGKRLKVGAGHSAD